LLALGHAETVVAFLLDVWCTVGFAEEVDELEVEVKDAVVGTAKCPAVMVRICAPNSLAPLNVVVLVVAVEVIVPKIAFTNLLQTP